MTIKDKLGRLGSVLSIVLILGTIAVGIFGLMFFWAMAGILGGGMV